MSNKEDIVNLLITDPEFVRWVKNPDNELDIYWKKWMEAHPAKIPGVKLAKEVVQGLQFRELPPSPDKKQALLNRILEKETKPSKFLPKGKVKKSDINKKYFSWDSFSQFSKVAAIIGIILVLSLVMNRYGIEVKPLEEPVVAEVVTIIKTTAYGEKLNFTLPDGTSVWLNSGSELRFPEYFDSLSRTVDLKGEGYFEIAKNEDIPFKVISGDLSTVALGTSFNVENRQEGKWCIALVSGSVKVENTLTDENIILNPGQQLQYLSSSKKTSVSKFSLEEKIGWIDGLLQFKNASFHEVIAVLERWYGVKIQVIGSPSRKWNLSGNYKNQNLDLVLDRISYVEQFEYSINRKNVYLKF